MAITYKVCKCRNPKAPDTPYFKATAVKTSDYDFNDLAEDIADGTTVTKADCMAVFTAMNVIFLAVLYALAKLGL